MKNFMAGTIFGIVVGAIGVTGVLTIFDRGVVALKEQAESFSK